MMTIVHRIHELFNDLPRIYLPIPENANIEPSGFFVLFEKGEKFENFDRIVGFGSTSTLYRTFVKGHKDKSMTRKLLGEAILLRANNKRYAETWRFFYRKHLDNFINMDYEMMMESEVSKYMRDNMSFAIFKLSDRVISDIKSSEDRKEYFRNEKKEYTLISEIKSTLIKSDEFQSSPEWLGRYGKREKIWDPKDYKDDPLMREEDFENFEKLVKSYN